MITEFTYSNDYKTWKRKNVTLRGMKEVGEENDAGAMLGRGLYTAFLSNKSIAKEYGKVNFVVNGIPKNPKIFNGLNDWEIWFYNTLVYKFSKEKGKEHPDLRDFNTSTTIEDELQKMGYDGIVIKGREMVNFKPKNVLYFGNENDLFNYYEFNVKSKLNESINLDVLEKHKELNSDFFDGDKLKKIEREKLLGLAKKFIKTLDIDKFKIIDIVMTGSNTNYNYTNESDVDIHILTDYSLINKDKDFVKNFFISKKDNWANKYEITMHKHPIEFFVQDFEQPREWSAEYSLVKNKWINKPKIDNIEIDEKTIESKAKLIMDDIDETIKSYDGENHDKVLSKLDKINSKIKNMRVKSLNDKKSEFAEGNLIFKLLRNNNYFDKIQEFKKKVLQGEYGLKESKILVINEKQYKYIKENIMTK